MYKVLLDTDILSEHLKARDKNVVQRAAEYGSQHGIYTFTSVTVHEIVYGLALKGAFAQLAETAAWLDRNEQIVPTPEDYYQAAIIRGSSRRKGYTLALPDCLIAAVAVRLDLPLVTGNTEDFQAIRRTGVPLTIENWRQP